MWQNYTDHHLQKKIKVRSINIKTGCQYVGYSYHSENLNWAALNLRLGRMLPRAAGWTCWSRICITHYRLSPHFIGRWAFHNTKLLFRNSFERVPVWTTWSAVCVEKNHCWLLISECSNQSAKDETRLRCRKFLGGVGFLTTLGVGVGFFCPTPTQEVPLDHFLRHTP